jgi:hypothetical protein
MSLENTFNEKSNSAKVENFFSSGVTVSFASRLAIDRYR